MATAEDFVVAWQEAPSVSAVAKRLKMPPATASQRAGYYRKRGVPLKRFPRGRPVGSFSIDVARLTAIAKKHGAKAP